MFQLKLRITGLNLALLLVVLMGCVQKKKHWVYFKKTCSEECSRVLLDSLDHHAYYYSKWLNARTLLLDNYHIKALQGLPEVSEITPVLDGFRLRSSNVNEMKFSFALDQIDASAFLDKNLTGRGVKIGIIDGGFLNADYKDILSHFFRKNKVKAYKDYITPKMVQYGGSSKLDDGHGVDVWANIGGVNSERNVQLGLATESEFYLARTDHGKGESRSEEEYLISALEWLDSMHVKLVNISLGYTDEFDDPLNNHLPEHINGDYTAVTRACQYAATERGMLLVVSAGNDGAKPWKILSAPADARGVLTVGATSYKHWDKISYSSIGPGSLPYLKPNVSCFSYNGTSFSAPVITGMAACIIQYDPNLSNSRIIEIIERSSNLYPFGNNYIGYGVPSCSKALSILEGKVLQNQNTLEARSKRVYLKFNSEEGIAIIFHKRDSIHVIQQDRLPFSNRVLRIQKIKEASHTTVMFKRELTEIQWIE